MAKAPMPCWLERDWFLAQFGTSRARAIAAYHNFVMAGIDKASPLAEPATRSSWTTTISFPNISNFSICGISHRPLGERMFVILQRYKARGYSSYWAFRT